VTVRSARGSIECKAMVTRRVRPLRVQGRTVHQIALPFHWGYAGEAVGAIANDLVSLTAEPNVSIQESKVFTCDVRPGRLAGNAPERPTKPDAHWPTREPMPQTPASAQPEGRVHS
jgi:formate dehydrogenase major subunit